MRKNSDAIILSVDIAILYISHTHANKQNISIDIAESYIS